MDQKIREEVFQDCAEDLCRGRRLRPGPVEDPAGGPDPGEGQKKWRKRPPP